MITRVFWWLRCWWCLPVTRSRSSAEAGSSTVQSARAEHIPDRNFVVCRLMYTSVRREPSGGGWRTDYPYGEINLTMRFSELTRTPVSRSGGRKPNHYVVRLTDDELFQCPFTMASDVGTIGFARRRGGTAAPVPAEGRLPVGRRFLG